MAGFISSSSQTEYIDPFHLSSFPNFSDRKPGELHNENGKKNNSGKSLKKAGWFVVKTAGLSLGILGGIAVAVPALGFGAAGVAAGSAAAAYQSAVLGGTIASGSIFATLQSIGAAGLAVSTKLGIIGGSAAAAGIHTAVKITKEDKEKLVEIKGRGKNKRSVTTQTYLTKRPSF